MNPALERQFFIADGEAHVMPDGRLYLYGSSDVSGKKEYCGFDYRVFSTDDLINWHHHGISFSSNDIPLYAPDAIHRDGKYYLYYCSQSNFEGVAVSDYPYGPFIAPKPIVGASGDSIDPAVFIDDDNQAYYLWGQFNLRGAKLNDDMVTLDLDSINRSILTEHEHGFHEGASMRKRGDKYYIVYTDISRGKATCMSYAYSNRPLGPYTKGGVIIDNIYADPETWNNHGSIEEYKGQWYVFYHKSSQKGFTCRRLCIEPIYFNEDGTIDEVEMTSQGVSGPIDAFTFIDASIACRMKGNPYIIPDKDLGKEILTDCVGGNWTSSWAEYKYLDFTKKEAKTFSIRARGKGTIVVKTASDIVLATCDIDSDTFVEYSVILEKKPEGILPLWLMFDGLKIDVDSFKFN